MRQKGYDDELNSLRKLRTKLNVLVLQERLYKWPQVTHLAKALECS